MGSELDVQGKFKSLNLKFILKKFQIIETFFLVTILTDN